ncbi:MAG: hypothetical protein AAGH79_19430, partial [Bacteroidota bacterium]
MWYILLPSLWLGGLLVSNPCEHHLEVSLQQDEDPKKEFLIDLCANSNGLWEWTCRPTHNMVEWQELTESPLFEILILAAFLEEKYPTNERILGLWLERQQATRTAIDPQTERLSWSSKPWTGRVEILWDTQKRRILGASFDRVEAIQEEKMVFRYHQQDGMEIQWGR